MTVFLNILSVAGVGILTLALLIGLGLLYYLLMPWSMYAAILVVMILLCITIGVAVTTLIKKL